MGNDKEHKWLESDFELLFNSLSKIVENQEQLRNGIIGLARKEGLEISFKNGNNRITLDGEEDEPKG